MDHDIRVATEDGHLCPVRVLEMGPGDAARIVFELRKGEKKYAVYWGNPHPDPLPANAGTEVPIRFGLLFEARGLGNGNPNDFASLEKAWQSGTRSFGGDMIDRPFIGYNPCTHSERTINKLTGSLFAPVDGEYQFAGACDDAGALYIDGKPLLNIPGCFADIRFNKTIDLTRGRHDFLMYHANYTGDMVISLGWKRPDAAKLELLNRESFGICARGMAGPMEQIKESLTADFTVEPIAETFEHDPSSTRAEQGNYSQLYRFKALMPHDRADVTASWDFGDGQTASGPTQDHVFLVEGINPVKLTFKVGVNTRSETNSVLVERNFAQGDQPQTNDPPIQSKIVANYDVNTLPDRDLMWAMILHAKAGAGSAAIIAADRLASLAKHSDPNQVYAALEEMGDSLNESQTLDLWQKVPTASDLQPRAVKKLSEMLLWQEGDFNAAADALRSFASRRDAGILRRRGESLVLGGKIDEGRAIFAGLHSSDAPDKSAAISGAMARTVEYYLTEKDVLAGADAWERWQNRFPDSFLEGYSVVLRVKLMALDKRESAAAKVAEAFADAVPNSSYAPQLLDEASKLLAGSDAAKSAQLHATFEAAVSGRSAEQSMSTAKALLGNKRLHLALPLVVYLSLAIPSTVYWRDRLNSDGVCYLHRALLLASGDVPHAISGYWSPGLIFSTAPILKFGGDSLHVIHCVLLIWGAVYVLGAQWLFEAMPWKLAASCVISLHAVRLIGPTITPDVLLGAMMMFYLVATRKKRWLLAGVIAGAGFWGKAYFLPFFIIQFPIVVVLQRAGWRALILGAIGLLLVAGPWIAALSVHERRFTFSTATRRNRFMQDVAPADVRAHPPDVSALPPDPFISNMEVTDHDAWPAWSPFQSRAFFKHQAGVAIEHIRDMIVDVWKFDHIGLALLGVLSVLAMGDEELRWLAISGCVYASGFLLVVYETR